MLVLVGGEAPPNLAVSVLNPPGQDPHVRDPCFCLQHLGQGQYSQVPSQGPQGERVGARSCPSLWSCSRHGREHAESWQNRQSDPRRLSARLRASDGPPGTTPWPRR